MDLIYRFLDTSSPTHLYIRQKPIELDVDLLDNHDEFYKTTKSLLVLFQIMGVMPIMRSAPGKLQTAFKSSNRCQVEVLRFQV